MNILHVLYSNPCHAKLAVFYWEYDLIQLHVGANALVLWATIKFLHTGNNTDDKN